MHLDLHSFALHYGLPIYSLTAFAWVARGGAGEEVAVLEAVLQTLPGAGEDPITIAWFKGFPDAWAAATTNPVPPEQVMLRYADWLRALPGQPVDRKSTRLNSSP